MQFSISIIIDCHSAVAGNRTGDHALQAVRHSHSGPKRWTVILLGVSRVRQGILGEL